MIPAGNRNCGIILVSFGSVTCSFCIVLEGFNFCLCIKSMKKLILKRIMAIKERKVSCFFLTEAVVVLGKGQNTYPGPRNFRGAKLSNGYNYLVLMNNYLVLKYIDEVEGPVDK